MNHISKNKAFLSTVSSFLPINIILCLSRQIRDRIIFDDNQKINGGKLIIKVNFIKKDASLDLIDFCLNFKRYDIVEIIIDDVNEIINDYLYLILEMMNKPLFIYWDLSDFNKTNFE